MVHCAAAMSRLPLLIRALVLVPLLAGGGDFARASLACGTGGGASCFEAAGGGSLGVAGVALLVLLGTAVAAAAARLAARGAGFKRLWLLGSGAVAALCAGQALVAGALGDPALLGGGWAELALFCVAAGALLAASLRLAPEAAALVREWQPSAPRIVLVGVTASRRPVAPAARRHLLFALSAPGRAPPAA
jgi:hypothetical protein